MSSITDVERRIMVRDMGWVLLIESYAGCWMGKDFTPAYYLEFAFKLGSP